MNLGVRPSLSGEAVMPKKTVRSFFLYGQGAVQPGENFLSLTLYVFALPGRIQAEHTTGTGSHAQAAYPLYALGGGVFWRTLFLCHRPNVSTSVWSFKSLECPPTLTSDEVWVTWRGGGPSAVSRINEPPSPANRLHAHHADRAGCGVAHGPVVGSTDQTGALNAGRACLCLAPT
jgi:hypothetical protein